MKIAFGIIGIFLATLIFLSIEVKDKPIFGHVYKVISPATKAAQKATENFFGDSVDTTQKYSKKLFDNSEPKLDSVKSKLSARKKPVAEPQEKITDEEKNQLDELIKSHH